MRVGIPGTRVNPGFLRPHYTRRGRTNRLPLNQNPQNALERLIFTIIVLILCATAEGLFGYDCTAPRAEIVQVSLNDVDQCNFPYEEINTTETNIQLLQLTKYSRTHVYYCSIEISRIINHCGMHSHNSMTRNGFASYLKTYSLI